tara:strand:+ start:657 stop:1319 length:663 start_codon:yes stop_codon:yes gene_type:complete
MSTTFTPSAWTGTKQQTAPSLNIKPNSAFYLLHSPFQWELVEMNDGHIWLPQFGQLYEIAGVNGIEETPQGPDSRVARMKLQESGQTVLDREYGYITRYETKYGGYYYTMKWDLPKQIGKKVYWNTDTDEYNKWRLSLVTMGVIDPPEIEVIHSKVNILNRKIDRKLKFQHIPEVKKEIDDLYALKKQMQTAYDSIHQIETEPAAATPKKKRTKKSDTDA